MRDENEEAGSRDGEQKNVILPEDGQAPSHTEQLDGLAEKHEVTRREVRNDGKIEVVCVDLPKNGAPHEYLISQAEGFLSFFLVNFQDGAIEFDEDVNGCQMEDLMAICIDRLEHFQNGDLACDENATALQYLKLAINALDNRTADRQARKVEGTMAN